MSSTSQQSGKQHTPTLSKIGWNTAFAIVISNMIGTGVFTRTLTVASLIFVKRKFGTFKSPFRPYLQIIYIIFSVWTLLYVLRVHPYEILIGLGIVAVGVGTYFIKRNH